MARRSTISKYLLLSLCGAVMIASCALTAIAQPKTGKEVYRGNIFYFGGGRNITTDFTLTITSYTPESDVRRLQDVLRSEGQGDFQKIIGKEKRGTIQVGTGLGLDLNAVWITQTGEGRKLSGLAERWLGFGELRRGARSTDYPFTYIELWIEEDGKIEGTLFPAARVRGKGGDTIEVENFGIYPARLTNVKQRRK
ncbi:MAG: hypothetical protein ABI977_00600 [Acidobacteriota bacterium]